MAASMLRMLGCVTLGASSGEARCEGDACHKVAGDHTDLLQRVSVVDLRTRQEQAERQNRSSSGRRGAPWTDVEMQAIRETMFDMFSWTKGKFESSLCETLGDEEYPCVLERFEPNEFAECDSEHASSSAMRTTIKCDGVEKRISPGAIPYGPRFLRLGFHDCFRYSDGTGGCDGCLNFDGMFIMKNIDERKTDPDTGNILKSDLPYDLTSGSNNNLAGTADLLERVYTDVSFAEFYMQKNNARCESNDPPHLYNYPSMGVPHPCVITPARPFTFYSGRSDCAESDKPDPAARLREYETTKEEIGANPHASGKEIVTWFEQQFGLTGRETVALMGVHVAGNYDSNNGVFRYTWCGREMGHDEILNNVYYRMLAYKPLYLQADLDVVEAAKAAGEPLPPPRTLEWKLNARGITPSRGPIQWFMVTHPEEGSNLTTDVGVQIHTTMLNTDMGLYFDFDVTSGGFPIRDGQEGRCVSLGLDVNTNEPHIDEQEAKGTCLQTKESGGKTLADIVEEYANDQDAWWNDFTDVMEKMLSNGHSENGRICQDKFDLVCTIP